MALAGFIASGIKETLAMLQNSPIVLDATVYGLGGLFGLCLRSRCIDMHGRYEDRTASSVFVPERMKRRKRDISDRDAFSLIPSSTISLRQ